MARDAFALSSWETRDRVGIQSYPNMGHEYFRMLFQKYGHKKKKKATLPKDNGGRNGATPPA